ncbi:hypothetical protein DN062_10180 [Nitrincola tibetensis]|uniref:Bacteriocin n=1 Tax=Nitrincola tibetensis TaxID=2219697 RepID=A0A364NLZ5_9GAMM|nr:hypothetical protein [Nitrincola tibetensis]RAU18138.1 hypothetical protein DN062_10180 [Nitrincola tibetensis]
MREINISDMEAVVGSGVLDTTNSIGTSIVTWGAVGGIIGGGVRGAVVGARVGGLWGAGVGAAWGIGAAAWDYFQDGSDYADGTSYS